MDNCTLVRDGWLRHNRVLRLIGCETVAVATEDSSLNYLLCDDSGLLHLGRQGFGRNVLTAESSFQTTVLSRLRFGGLNSVLVCLLPGSPALDTTALNRSQGNQVVPLS